MTPAPTPTRRYGCLECRADAELALDGRLDAGARARFEDHLWRCRACREAHEVMVELYRGPAPPRSRGGHDPDVEFSAILQRVADEERSEPRLRALASLGVACLVAMATTLALLLVMRSDEGSPFSPSSMAPVAFEMPDDEVRPFGHPAMLYGRLLHGRAQVVGDDGEVRPGRAFRAGTLLATDAGESAQVQLLGRMLTNVTPNSRLRWRSLVRGRVDLELERGMVAIRYEREPEDPVLVVHTPSADVVVVGTVFTVEVAEGGEAVVSVLRGRVEVREPEGEETIAEVWAGDRFDVGRSFYADVGRHEVAAALPLSYETRGRREGAVPGGIPSDWLVPGLPERPDLRVLEHVVDIARPPRVALRPARAAAGALVADDGDALLQMLLRDVEATRAEAIQAELERCRELYLAGDTRYRAAECLTDFVARHGEHAGAEAFLLIGSLRMDYAGDYQAAKADFRRFLERAPESPEAELARYRLWLASTEQGDIQEAKRLGREYLRAHPHGRHVGLVLQRFPGLAGELQR